MFLSVCSLPLSVCFYVSLSLSVSIIFGSPLFSPSLSLSLSPSLNSEVMEGCPADRQRNKAKPDEVESLITHTCYTMLRYAALCLPTPGYSNPALTTIIHISII